MENFSRIAKDAFDFSKDANSFRQKLWEKLKASMEEDGVQPLEDDDLAWVYAAGTPHPEHREKLLESPNV